MLQITVKALAKMESREVETLATYSEISTLIKSLYTKPIQKGDYHQLQRKEQVIIFRLRTGHERLNNKYAQQF